MPERNERFFWLDAENIEDPGPDLIEKSNDDFAAGWHACPLNVTACVRKGPHRLWLFRLAHGTGNRALATDFNRKFLGHADTLKERLRASGVQVGEVKRQTNMVTPMLTSHPLGEWPRTDLGLHPVNDQHNGQLATYSYNSGKYLQPPLLQLADLCKLHHTVQLGWQDVACDCRNPGCKQCDGTGCYDCFVLDCPQCSGTGWKNFSRWAQGGYRINYETGYPFADLSCSDIPG